MKQKIENNGVVLEQLNLIVDQTKVINKDPIMIKENREYPKKVETGRTKEVLKTVFKIIFGVWLASTVITTYLAFTPGMNKYSTDLPMALLMFCMVPLMVGFVTLFHEDIKLKQL